MDYKTADYSNWDLSGQGRNLIKLLTEEELNLWAKALPLQDKRADKGHAETVAYFSHKLQKHLGGERKVVIPASILHDVGYGLMRPVELGLFQDMYFVEDKDPDMAKTYNPAIRARHQQLGARFARQLLEELQFLPHQINHITEIISQHDTRKGFYSYEDGIVRSADKLWRLSYPSFVMCLNKWGWIADYLRKREEPCINEPGFYPNDEIREIAHMELQASLGYIMQNPKTFEWDLKQYKTQSQ